MFSDSSCAAKQFKMNKVGIKKRNQKKREKPIKPNSMRVTRTLFLVTISNAYWYWYLPLCRFSTKQEYVQLQNDIKIVSTLKFFSVQFSFFLFFQSQSWLWGSTAAFFRESAECVWPSVGFYYSSSFFKIRWHEITITSNLLFIHSFLKFWLNCLGDAIFHTCGAYFFVSRIVMFLVTCYLPLSSKLTFVYFNWKR